MTDDEILNNARRIVKNDMHRCFDFAKAILECDAERRRLEAENDRLVAAVWRTIREVEEIRKRKP